MADQLTDIQQAIAISPTPATTFADLSQNRKREVFFRLSEVVQESLVADMNREQLRVFIRALDPDEATDVLGMANEQMCEAVLQELGDTRRESLDFC